MSLLLEISPEGMLAIAVGETPWIAGARPRLTWRRSGEEGWRDSEAVLPVFSAASPDLLSADLRFDETVALHLELRRLDGQTWQCSGTLRNQGDAPLYLARFHYLYGCLVADAGLLAPQPHAESCRLFRRGDRLPPVKEQFESLWRSMHVQLPRFSDPLHLQPDWAMALDTGILTPGWNAPGLHFGYTTPITAFGEVGLRCTGDEAHCFAGLLLDGVRLEAGQTRVLDALRIRSGDWQESLRAWAVAAAEAVGVKPVRPPLVGYCSWYQVYSGVTAEHIERATTDFAGWPVPPGGRTVQIDDGFQVMPGNWGPNERFAAVWDKLPARIAATGSIPGLWLAPSAVFHRHPICAEHPDWIQRLPDGQPAVTFSNWGWCAREGYRWGDATEPTYFLDPDHPEVRRFMRDIVVDAVRRGWKYLKLDFTYGVSPARVAFDPGRTRMETLREMYRLFREAAGPETLICACIGEMGRYALGYADTARLGGDIGHDWGSITRNLPDTLIRLATNGVWWNADPDVFHMRQENVHLSDEEAWCLTGTIGMLGGVFLTSDFASQWSEAAKAQIQRFWNAEGPRIPSEFHVAYSVDGVPRAVRFSYADSVPCAHRVLLYNWRAEPAEVRVPLADLGLPVNGRGKTVSFAVVDDGVARVEGGDLVAMLPPHSLRRVDFNERAMLEAVAGEKR